MRWSAKCSAHIAPAHRSSPTAAESVTPPIERLTGEGGPRASLLCRLGPSPTPTLRAVPPTLIQRRSLLRARVATRPSAQPPSGGPGAPHPTTPAVSQPHGGGVGRITPQDNVRSRSHDGPGVRAFPGGSGARWVVYMTPDGAQLASTRSVCAQVPSVASSRWCAPSPSHAHATRPSRYTRRVVLVYLYSCTCVRGGLRRGALVCRGAAVE